MKIWFNKLMAPTDETSDGGGGGADVKPAEVKPAEVKPAEVKPAEVKPAEVKPAEVKPAEVKPTEVKPTDANKPSNLLFGDDDDAAGDKGGDKGKRFDYTAGEAIPIGKDQFGNDIELSGAEIADFMKALPAEFGDTTPVLVALTEFEAKRLAADTERDMKFSKELEEASRKEFGADIKRVVGEARRGGRALFGEVWTELSAIPMFANDPRIIRALSNYGRSVTPDGGVIRPSVRKSGAFTVEGWKASSATK